MMWMIRNPGGQYAQDLRDKGVVGIGWSEATPNVKSASTPQEFYDVVRQTYPELRGQEIVNAGRQLFKFFREIKEGDTVLMILLAAFTLWELSKRDPCKATRMRQISEANPTLVSNSIGLRYPTERAIKEIVQVIEQGGFYRALLDRLTELEARQTELNARQSQAAQRTFPTSTRTSGISIGAGSNVSLKR